VQAQTNQEALLKHSYRTSSNNTNSETVSVADNIKPSDHYSNKVPKKTPKKENNIEQYQGIRI